jgi:LAO/AO transport system kinase
VTDATAIRGGDRRALARGITLVESSRADHRAEANALLEDLLDATGGAIRLGISGPPGVGKSTFIEALGTYLTSAGHGVAVLAVDPSSARSGGSILGDKTRMEGLAANPAAFIRPSPSGGELGGVARGTRDAILLCEAAGYDVVLVETVGVGQSEVAVGGLTDLFLLLASPSGGDDLQGIKRGIMEHADVVAVTKADGALAEAARHTAADLRVAAGLLQPRPTGLATQVLLVSAVTGVGVAEVWEAIAAAHAELARTDALDQLRATQARAWMWVAVERALLDRLRSDPAVAALLDEVEAAVVGGRLSPSAGAERLLARFGQPDPPR